MENLTKIFGPDAASVLPAVEEGKTKSEIQSETGHIVGVNNANFELAAGQVFAIMGLSGSGKSTLIRCINRLIEPTAGKIYLDDPDQGERDITAMSMPELRELRANHMSMVFQRFALFPHRTVLENTVYGLEIQGRPWKESADTGRKMLEMVGLAEWAEAYPSELSGGMQQRVGLARALATEAKIMLMDEPFSALDPLIRVHMQQELLKIQERLARTILFITHDLDEAMYIGDRIAIMDAGKIVQIGTPEEILTNPRTEYVARFVEHADPTNVITARTIMLPFDGGWFETVDSGGDGRWLARRGQPHVTYHLSASGGFAGMAVEGEAATVRSLNEVLDEIEKSGTQGRRRHDVALSCAPDTVLGDLLRGRTYATLPAVVIDGDGTARGVIDETELIGGILEKRGTAGAAGAA